jgi:hypothetical protein
MYVVKRLLSINGHIYHPLSELLSMLRYVLGSQAEFYYIWLVLEGYVVNVSEKMVGESGAWVAWRGNLLGEVRFAWRVVEHCHNGGKMEILCGEPGTGKTQKLAERLAAEKGNALGGSAQHDSAKLLTERLKALECEHTVGTVHRGYKVMKMLRGGDTKAMHRNLYYADELGQLACDAAGAMAMRWKLGSEVLFSIGGGQNLPVGAGRAGEDLMDWLKMNPSKLPSCKLNVLTDNHRTKNDPNARGIVEAFRAIARGDLPKEGPGMILVYCYDASEVIDKAVSIAKKSGALCLVPTRSTADDVNCGFIALDRYDPDLDFTDLSYHKDEKLVVQHAGERTLMLGLRTGDEVIVAEDTVRNYDPKQLIAVWRPKDDKRVELKMGEIVRPFGRTGHAAQGLERDDIVVGLIKTKATTRRWLYTAVSRARKTCTVVCTRKGLEECVKDNPKRKTLLPMLLDRAYEVISALPTLAEIEQRADSFLLEAKQVDGESLARKLVNPPTHAEQHVAGIFPLATQNRIKQLSADGAISKQLKTAAINALNGIIASPMKRGIKSWWPIYNEKVIATETLSARAATLRANLTILKPIEAVELNRLILEAVFQDELQVVKTKSPG